MAGVASAHPAHAKVLDALPKIGSTITQAPTTVTVFTAENINPDPKKSNLFVYGPGGELISQGNAKVSLSNPKEMSVTIKPDASNRTGVYVVQWITVSAEDGDPDQGAFVFTVKSAAAPTPIPATSGTTPPSTPSGSGTSGIPVWVPIAVGLVALLVGLGGGLGIGRRTAGSSVSALRRSIAQQQQEEEAPGKRT